MPKNIAAGEKLENQDFDLFKAIDAIDRKDYGYFDRLTSEQQRKFVPFMLVHWISAVKGNGNVQTYYLQSTDHHANTYLFNENISKHPKLVWLMLCAASPGIGKQYHQWIPHIRDRVKKLRDKPTNKEIKEYFKKIYPKVSESDIDEITKSYIDAHIKKMYIADKFPELKFDEIELLSELITSEDIKEYEKDLGN